MTGKYRQGYIKKIDYDYYERLGEGIKMTIQIIDPDTGKPWVFVDFTTVARVPQLLNSTSIMSFTSLVGKACLVEKVSEDESKFIKVLD